MEQLKDRIADISHVDRHLIPRFALFEVNAFEPLMFHAKGRALRARGRFKARTWQVADYCLVPSKSGPPSPETTDVRIVLEFPQAFKRGVPELFVCRPGAILDFGNQGRLHPHDFAFA